MKVLISVIVPVYNVKKYVSKCVDSILNQTMRELEIIIIDDGSTDGSSEILDKYAKKDTRIKVIHNSNHGYGYTINCGIKLAQGEYIGIVESDDSIEEIMYETLYKVAKQYDLDFVKSDRKEVEELFDGTEKITRNRNERHKNLYNVVFKPIDHLEFYFTAPDTWSGIYKRDFLEKNYIRHNETPGASYQDIGFAFQVYTLAVRCMLLDEAFYRYKIDNIESSIHNKGKVYAVCEEYDFVYKFLERNKQKISIRAYNAYYIKRYGAYLTTIPRISKNYLLQFLEKFRDDYIKDRECALFNEKLFDAEQLKRINKIIDSPKKYFCSYMDSNKQIYKQIIEPYKRVIIYGMGNRAMKLWNDWNPTTRERRSTKFCFATSERQDEEFFDGIPIYKIDSLTSYKREAIVIVAVGNGLRDELINKLKELEFSNYIYVSDFWDRAKEIRDSQKIE